VVFWARQSFELRFFAQVLAFIAQDEPCGFGLYA